MKDIRKKCSLPYYPICNILGVNVSALNMKEAVRFIKEFREDLSGQYICVSNVHTTVMSYEDEGYRRIQNEAAMVLPDGGPLSVIGRKMGFKEMGRVTGPDFMGEILKVSVRMNYSHYFYGSTDETLKKLRLRLIEKYGPIQIAGMYSPPFRKLSFEEDEIIINKINQAKADFVWVGLGAPKQEIWMAQHKDKVNGVMVGVGAAFDYYAGNIKRAPKWMQRNNLEWIYRLCQEPTRLFGRYFSTNIKFLLLLIIRR